MKELILGFIIKRWRYILTALIALIIGGQFGSSQKQLDQANAQTDSVKKQLAAKSESYVNLVKENNGIKKKNEELQIKIGTAASFIKLSAI